MYEGDPVFILNKGLGKFVQRVVNGRPADQSLKEPHWSENNGTENSRDARTSSSMNEDETTASKRIHGPLW